MDLPYSGRVSRVPPYSGYPMPYITFRLQDCHLVSCPFPESFDYVLYVRIRVLTPHPFPDAVWAVPRSLATTKGIVCLLSFPPGT